METPLVFKADDGSVILEWIKDDRRFGIVLDTRLQDSSWYYVSKTGDNVTQVLPLEMTEYFKKYFEVKHYAG